MNKMIRRGAPVARPADGGRASRWAALASDSDSDSAASAAASPPPKGKKVRIAPGAPVKAPAQRLPAAETKALLAALMARGGLIDGDPEMAALDAADACWGDLFMGPVVPAVPVERQLRGTSEEFWAQPFTVNLDVYTMDVYDTRRLTDEEWNAMMSWLYWKGWSVDDFTRDGVCAESDDLPARRWCPPRAETPDPEPVECRHWSSQPSWEVLPTHGVRGEVDEPSRAAVEPKAPKKKALRAAPVPVMRFCRAVGACTEAGCRYVHGDTIPKIDKPCGFGAECGASDPTGVKRSQCLYMHPGEVWTADLCIHRP
jgi:hypothetical protein